MKLRVCVLIISTMLTAFGQAPRRTTKPVTPKPAAPPPAAAPSNQPQAWPIGKLSVEGNKLYPAERILAVTGMKVGEMAGKAEFDAARDKLLASGAFESVGYKFDPIPGTRTNAGTFQVSEITQLFPYRFEELRVDEKALREHLKSKEPLYGDKVPGTQAVLDRMTKEVQAFAKNDQIIGKVEGVGNLAIVFKPSNLPSVAEVTFKGNSVINTAKLQQAVAGAAIGAVYSENRFRQVLDASIRPVYESIGYLGVQFPSFDAIPSKTVNGVAVTVTVKEGAVYKLSNVELKGELAQSKELIKVGGFQIGEPVNYEKVRSGVDDIRKALRRRGYINAHTSAERKLNDQQKTMSLTVMVDPGQQYTMGKLTIDGLDVETEPHVRKLWALKRGQPFNAEYPDYFLGRLVEDQLFDNLGKTTSSVIPDPEKQTVDVTLVLKGAPRPAKPKIP